LGTAAILMLMQTKQKKWRKWRNRTEKKAKRDLGGLAPDFAHSVYCIQKYTS